MARRLWLIFFLSAGLLCIAWGLLVPAHMRAVDAVIIQRAGKGTPSLVELGVQLAQLGKIGPAGMFQRAADLQNVSGRDRLDQAIESYAKSSPKLLPWAAPDPLLNQIGLDKLVSPRNAGQPFMDLAITPPARAALRSFFVASRRSSSVRSILGTLARTNLVDFAPTNSPAGAPYESVVLLTALLFQGDYLSATLRDQVEIEALGSGAPDGMKKLEPFYLDLNSLARRFNWGQLVELLRPVESLATFKALAEAIRDQEAETPMIFAAVQISQTPKLVVKYLSSFEKTGLKDLAFGVGAGRGSLRELLARQRQVYHPGLRSFITATGPGEFIFRPLEHLSATSPILSLVFKFELILLGCFFLARSSKYFGEEPVLAGDAPALGYLGLARHALFGVLMFIGFVLALEPFLLAPGQKADPKSPLSFPKFRVKIVSPVETVTKPMPIDPRTVVALFVFLALQAIIYTLGLIKLSEIKRQEGDSKLKLRLLDNEENFFDLGLYAGLGGTGSSLVLLSFGVIKASLMAAYASTLFGIIFVAILKVVHVRPYRRKLIMDVETTSP